MLTKGDVLLALGRIKSAFGSAENMTLDIMGPSGRRASEVRLVFWSFDERDAADCLWNESSPRSQRRVRKESQSKRRSR